MEELLNFTFGPSLVTAVYAGICLFAVLLGAYLVVRLILSLRDIPESMRTAAVSRIHAAFLRLAAIWVIIIVVAAVVTGFRWSTPPAKTGTLDTSRPGVLDTSPSGNPARAADNEITERGREIQEQRMQELDTFREEFFRARTGDTEPVE